MNATTGNKVTEKLEKLFEENRAALNAELPLIMKVFRKKAFTAFLEKGFPSRNSEEYKYTDFSDVFKQSWYFFLKPKSDIFVIKDVAGCKIQALSNDIVTVANGFFCKREIVHDNSAQNPDADSSHLNGNKKKFEQPDSELIVANGLHLIDKVNPGLFEKYYGKLSKNGDEFSSLNGALARNGFFIYVPENMDVQNPIQINNILIAKKKCFTNQRNLIIVEPGARAKIIICDENAKKRQYLNNTVTEIFVGENASLEICQIQNQRENTTAINSTFIEQTANSSVHMHLISLGGELIRNNLNIRLNGENAEANLFGMSFLNKNQHVDNSVKIIHAKPHCRSNQLFKNVINDESEAVFSGLIHVVPDAQKTSAFQRNSNMVLADAAQMHTRPQLIIEADDVKCSHGATVGQIDEEALFYMRARGIGEKQARSMLMKAFAGEVTRNITIESVQEHINELIDRRLGEFE